MTRDIRWFATCPFVCKVAHGPILCLLRRLVVLLACVAGACRSQGTPDARADTARTAATRGHALDTARVEWSRRTKAALRPRTVVVYLDLSGSMRPAALQEPLARLSQELRPRDHLVIYPITAHTASELTPVFDTVFAGSMVDQVTAVLGLSTRISRHAAEQVARRLSARLLSAERAARAQYGRAHATSIIDAVCDVGRTARLDATRETIGLVLTDGIEESAFANVATSVPDVRAAARLANLLRADLGCDLGATQLTLRLIGVRHSQATVHLTRWWSAMLIELGYPAALDDVVTHRLRPLLSIR